MNIAKVYDCIKINKFKYQQYTGRDIVVRMTNNIIEKMIWDFFSERIDNAFAIAGIMGNLFAESKLRPDVLEFSTHERLGFSSEEYTKAVDDDTYLNFSDDHAGYGLAQWTDNERKNNLYAHAKDKGVSISDPTLQMEFLWEELNGGHIDVLYKLIESKSVQTASDIFFSDFENPFDQSDRVRQMRASYSRNYYYKYLTLEQLDESLSSYTDWRSDVCFFLQDYDTGEILYERNADRKCPIGSITKLMTAYSLMKRFLYDASRLNEITVIDAETARMSNDRDFSGNEQFKAGEKVSLEQLLKLALISSACSSAVALVKHFYKEPAEFVGQMNRDASELSIDASFADCFGIDPHNQGSARGIAGLGAAVISDYPWILYITAQKAVSHHGIEYPSTSILLKEDAVDGLDGLKTGTTNCAGACYLSTAQRRGHRVIAVVLNAQNEWERQMVIMDLLEYGLRKSL